MKRVLFVSNGNGEAAIADRIAAELRAIMPDASLDHLALVGEPISDSMREVGPRHTMPSGGLIAMGNVGNLMRDLRAGLLPLVASQRRFLRRVRGSYAVAVAVGDVYALAMTLRARSSTVFVGTAKSVSVARYGAFEERMLARATACFVRDEATAQALRGHGLSAEPSANVIVDLFAPNDDPAVEAATTGFLTMLALFPGSRVSAYDDAAFLLEVLREIAGSRPEVGAVLSIARGLDAGRFATGAQRAKAGRSPANRAIASPSLCLCTGAPSCARGRETRLRYSKAPRWFSAKPARRTKVPPQPAFPSWLSPAIAVRKHRGTAGDNKVCSARRWPLSRAVRSKAPAAYAIFWTIRRAGGR